MSMLSIRDRPAAADLAHAVVDSFVDELGRPSFRAGLAVSMASAAVLARLGAGTIVTVVIAVSLGAAAEGLYGMGEEITARLGGMYATGQD
jgi:hypothetical protein